eukprot:5504574-Pyramimonas_sp.AAC.1
MARSVDAVACAVDPPRSVVDGERPAHRARDVEPGIVEAVNHAAALLRRRGGRRKDGDETRA